MTLFVYYLFLNLRYSCTRNPYTRNTFGDLRVLLEGYAQNPSCPAVVRNTVSKLVSFISQLAFISQPVITPPSEQEQ